MNEQEVDMLLEDKLSEINRLVEMLHEVWAFAVDTGSLSEEEWKDVTDRGEAMLREYGIRP